MWWVLMLPDTALASPLAELITAAHKAAPEAQIADARLDLARGEALAGWSGVLPSLSAQGSYARNEFETTFDGPEGQVVISPQDQWDGSLNLNIPIVAPSAWTHRSAAARREDAAESTRESDLSALELAVVDAYLSLALASGERRIALLEQDAARARRDLARERVAQGTLPDVELMDATATLASAHAHQQDVEITYRQALDRLKRLTGVTTTEVVLSVDLIAAPPPGRNRTSSEVRAAEGQMEAAQADLWSARWRYAPTLSANASQRWTNASGFSGETSNWQVGATLSFTLFDGLAREASVAMASARTRLQEAELQRARNDDALQSTLVSERLVLAEARLAAADATRDARTERARIDAEELAAGRTLPSTAANSAAEASAAEAAWEASLADLLSARAEARVLLGFPIVERT